MRFIPHLLAALLLTVLTQLGGLAWLGAMAFRRRLLAFALLYAALSISALWLAPLFGRVAVGCSGDGPLRSASWVYCALNRSYVSPDLANLLTDLAEEMDRAYPGTVTLTLDGTFPFLDAMPLLPHLSHADGRQVDLAFWYRDADGYASGALRSPLGYFAFEDGPTDCPDNGLTLRWDLDALQPVWRDVSLEPGRMRHALDWLAADPRTGKIFIEPHLVQALGVAHPKIRFQGCRAARHDDHIHLQL